MVIVIRKLNCNVAGKDTADMQTLVEDFLQYLRHERGQSDNTATFYSQSMPGAVKFKP